MPFDASFLGCDLRQGVLRNGIGGVPTKGAAQILQLLHGEAAVLGQHNGVGVVETSNELLHLGNLVRPCHWVSFRFIIAEACGFGTECR